MNLLLDEIPEEVEIDGRTYAINANFRESIIFELMMQDTELMDDEKIVGALSIYYDDMPHDLEKAVEKLLWFYRCGKEVEQKKKDTEDNEGDSEEPANPKQVFSYEADADYIYAAFLTQYGMDLQDVEFLHWWKFKALFNALKEDNKMVKIMEYRSMDINSDMSKKEKEFYRSMKRLYALPDGRTEIEKEADFHDSLARII